MNISSNYNNSIGNINCFHLHQHISVLMLNVSIKLLKVGTQGLMVENVSVHKIQQGKMSKTTMTNCFFDFQCTPLFDKLTFSVETWPHIIFTR